MEDQGQTIGGTMQIGDEVLEHVLECFYYYLENHGSSKQYASALQSECEMWNYDEDPKVHPSSTYQATKTLSKPPRSYEVIEWMGGEEVQHFEYDAGKVTSKNPHHVDKDAREILFNFALETMAFSRPRALKEGKSS
jgi:hypothetical protein